MENQQEIGGAQALLQLGSKNRDEERESKQGDSEASLNISNGELDIHDKDGHPIDDVAEHGTTEEHDAEGDFGDAKTNQQINDAVEAAVMRYVGGTLDDTGDSSANGSKKNKRKLQQDDIMSNIHDFNQWTGFLEADIAGNNQDFNSFATSQNQQQGTLSPQYVNKLRKKPKILPQSHNEIDPELTGISNIPDNELLVPDSMLDPRELAKHLGNGSLQDLDFSATLNSMPPHQAQQVLLAASNVANNQTNGLESSAVINQLMHAASNAQTKKERKNQKPAKPEESLMDYQGVKTSPTDLKKHKFNHLTSIDSLIEEASAQACNWYNSLPEDATKGPRLFSPEEIQAVDHFINGYCHIHRLSREDVCHRIWSNDRKKDNFWESLTRILPYRSRASVYKHVRRQYHVFEVRAKWDKKDDEILRSFASTKEGNWKEIGDAMGRMPEDCRDRWRNYVKCGDNRVLNKWSEEEERKLKDIVSDMLENSSTENKRKGNAINWTVVSERMDGVRSRIQCRYKWNKLLKRSSAQKASLMNTETRLWLLQKIQRLGFPSVDNIDWDYLLHLFMEERKALPPAESRFDKLIDMSAADFKMAFEKLVSDRKDLAKMTLLQLLDHLIGDVYMAHGPVSTAIPNGTQGSQAQPPSLPLHRHDVSTPSNYATTDRHVQEHPIPDDDATSIANAAVAAVSVGVNGEDPQTHEYNLWR